MKKKIALVSFGVFIIIPFLSLSQWSLTGNSSTTPGTHFLGTTDAQRLVFKTNSIEQVTILSNGHVGLGLNNPGATLEINTLTGGFAAGWNNSFRLKAAAPAIQLWDTENVGWQIGEEHGHLYFGTLLTNTTTLTGHRLFLKSNGDIGIGTTTPISKLNVNGVVTVTGGAGAELLGGQYSGVQLVGGYSTPVSGRMIIGDNSGWKFSVATRDNQSVLTDLVTFQDNGNVGIGTTTPQAKLAVNGDIFSKKVKVTQTGWPDYVFNSTYSLRPLAEVEQFIRQYHHLPEVPDAAEVEKNGLDLGNNQVVLLKKIEELTLYIIEQNKRVEELEEKVQTIKKR